MICFKNYHLFILVFTSSVVFADTEKNIWERAANTYSMLSGQSQESRTRQLASAGAVVGVYALKNPVMRVFVTATAIYYILFPEQGYADFSKVKKMIEQNVTQK